MSVSVVLRRDAYNLRITLAPWVVIAASVTQLQPTPHVILTSTPIACILHLFIDCRKVSPATNQDQTSNAIPKLLPCLYSEVQPLFLAGLVGKIATLILQVRLYDLAVTWKP
jgi:hypothetical protein